MALFFPPHILCLYEQLNILQKKAFTTFEQVETQMYICESLLHVLLDADELPVLPDLKSRFFFLVKPACAPDSLTAICPPTPATF